jgi:hypothetical protein
LSFGFSQQLGLFAQSMDSNKLENWIKNRFANETEVLNALQEYGVISDNCVDAKDVGNDKEAMMWVAKNFEHYQRYKV